MRLVGLLAWTALALAGPAAAQNAPLVLQPGETLLEVEAEGTHLQRPDVMTIVAGVVTTGATAGEALQANSALAARLIEVVRARNVDARDIRTTELRVAPRFERRDRDYDDEMQRRIVGYVATNNVELRLRDLGQASALLDALLSAGANNVAGPAFSLAEPGPARAAARRDAVAMARREADDYAAALGMRVARVLRVSERSRHVYADESIIITGSRMTTPPIEPGELATNVTVWVDFALAPQ